MAFQSVPDVAEAVVSFLAAGQQVVNVLNFARPGGYDQAAIDSLAQKVDFSVGSYWKPLIHTSVSYINTTVRGLENPVDLFAVQAASAGAGAHSGSAMPNNVTWAMRFTTGATGRTARGRMYVCGISSGAIDEPTQSILLTEANAWVAAMVSTQQQAFNAGWDFCVVSRQLNKVVRPLGTYRLITGIGYHDRILDSQRGRLP